MLSQHSFWKQLQGRFPWMHHEYSQRIQLSSGDLGAHFPAQELDKLKLLARGV